MVVRGDDGQVYDSHGRLVHDGGPTNGPNGIPLSAAARMASSAVVRSNSLRSTSPPRYLQHIIMNSDKKDQDTIVQDNGTLSLEPDKNDNALSEKRLQPATAQERKIIKECALVSLIS